MCFQRLCLLENLGAFRGSTPSPLGILLAFYKNTMAAAPPGVNRSSLASKAEAVASGIATLKAVWALGRTAVSAGRAIAPFLAPLVAL